MALISFVSHRGSPGTTALAFAVAAAWPTSEEQRKVFVEADPAGGVLALRLGIPEDPGLVSLAAAARHGLGRNDLWDHAQALPGGLPVVPAPSSIGVASQLLATSSAGLGQWFADLGDVVVIADAGRLSPASESTRLVRASDLVVMVAAPVADQLHAGAQQLATIQPATSVGWCLVGHGTYEPAAVENAYGVPVLGTVPEDVRGAEMLFSASSAKRIGRTPLVRAASTLAVHLAPWVNQQSASDERTRSNGSDHSKADIDDPTEATA